MSTEGDVAIGRAVKELRTRLGLRQEELAGRADLGQKQTVSEIERGRRALKATEVVRLAQALHVEAHDLLTGSVPAVGPYVLWRKIGADHSRAEAEARLHHRSRRYGFLEGLVGDDQGPKLPCVPLDITSTSYEDAETMADEVRRTLQLGDVPGAGLRENLESHWRIKIFEDLLAEGSGATTKGSYGPAILENAAEPPSRRSFSLAHELFHLLTWESVAVRSETLPGHDLARKEQLADCFARSLLMPRDVLIRRIEGRRFARLADLLPVAVAFSVSLTALLWRLVNLGTLQREPVEAFLATPWGKTDRGWAPPATLERPLPRRYVTLAFTAYRRGDLSIGRLAELLETTVGMVGHRLCTYGLDLDCDEYEAEVLPA